MLFYASRILLVLLALGLLIGAIMFVANLASSNEDDNTPEITTTESEESNEPGPVEQEYDVITDAQREDEQQEAQEEQARAEQEAARQRQQAQAQARAQAEAEQRQRRQAAARREAQAANQPATKGNIPNTGPAELIAFISIPVIVYASVRYYDAKRLLNNPNRR